MAIGEIGAYGESVYQQVLPLHGPDPDGLAHAYIGAVTHPMREIDELVRDTPEGTGWSIILDADDAPVKGLWWLAQLAGVKLRQPKMITKYNLIPNPSSEFSPLSHFTVRSTVTRVIGGTHGNYMARGTVTSNGQAGLIFSTTIDPYTNVTVGVDLITLPRAAKIAIEFDDGGFTPLLTVASSTSTAIGRRTLTAQAPAGTVYVYFQILIPSALIGEVYEVDALSMIPNATVDEYFDGGSPGAAWIIPENPEAAGAVITRLETDDEWGAYARDAIKRQGGKNRGTPDAIISAAQDTLTGQKVARLLERVGGNAYALELVTRPSETPDPTATLAAATTQKPGGDSLIHTLTEDLLIDEDTGDIDSATGTIDVPT